ncbi:uncharacterized protein EV154DRAFT_461736 [Mucor mucedo]|uniref:uncharacterized protein n=1 Tax=Mucor mucedo TaxID=29922 RepID=UPI002220F75F|nr:uncharacterized protein EV154DRAFT_461736 [Mucor mucedo]KAI7892893.1 hypothetical protein EV154DRAFT_461736 [Mucor mucedo]
MPLAKNKNNETILNTTFTRYLSPNISTSCSTPSSNGDSYFTPTPTPSRSKNSLINPIPSTSCKSAFSVQSFHTATGDYEEDDHLLDDPGIAKKAFESTLFVVDEEGSSSNKINNTIGQQKHYYRPKMVSTNSSSTTNDFVMGYPNGLSTTTTNNSMMIHPTSLSHSYTSNSMFNNYFYYGSLGSAAISRSPSGSYMNEYYNEDYGVVLDDGTLQKRSVSLSTMPISTPLEFNKKKFKGNYNHFYYQNNEDDPSQHKSASRSQAEEFYAHLLEEERRGLLLTTVTSSDPKMIIQDLQPNDYGETSDDNTDNLSNSRKRRRKYEQHSQERNCISSIFISIFMWIKRHVFTLSYKQKMVLKCSFAYLLGSLFTFVPVLNQMLGTARLSSHVIATVTVFFNPSKTVGGMVEAAGYGLLYTVCALLLSLLSMVIAIYLRSEEYYVTSCCVTLGFWLAGSTFALSFIKAHYNKPSIGTGCGLYFMIIFPVLVREGSVIPSDFDPTYIEEMFSIVTIGTAISAFVCWFIWPMTATKKLKTDINDTLIAVRILVKLLTKTFLLDSDLPEFTANEHLHTAINSHRTSFISLKASLADAKREYYNLDIWKHAEGYDSIVSSLQRLAQHIGGLRSSCGLQFEVMKATDNKKKGYGSIETSEENMPKIVKKKKVYNIKAGDQRKRMEYELKKEHRSTGSLHGSDEDDVEEEDQSLNATDKKPKDGYYHIEQDQNENEEGALVQFIKTVSPPMKSLAYTCKQTVVHLESRFTSSTTDKTPPFNLLRQNLAMAISLFEESQQLALTRMYRRKMKSGNKKKRRSEQSLPIDPQELQSHLMKQFPAEDVFLVYFFVFCLLEFAKELMVLVECVKSVYEYDEEQRNKGGIWTWIKRYLISPFWCLCCCFYTKPYYPKENGEENIINNDKPTTPVITKKSSIDSFVPNNNNTFNTLHTPKPKTKIRRFFLSLWGFFSWFRTHTVRYALKSTLIALAITVMAFIPATREYFLAWKMDWTLITVMAVMSPTVGGTNQVAVLRVLATMLGSIIAVLFYLFLPHQGPLLLFMSWAFSIPCFWMILNHKHGRFGMFSLLSYNLVVPFMYNHINEDVVIDVVELAFMRCATVSAGVLIGLVVTAYIWPFEARKEMRKGLSDLLIRLSWLYKQLVSEYSEYNNPPISETRDTQENNYSHMVKRVISNTKVEEAPNRIVTSVEELEALARRNEARSIQFQHVELELQVTLVELQGLLVYAPDEPRLKGPFPAKTYEAMLTSCQNILDKFLSIRIVILKDVWATQVRRDLMLPASRELMEMAGSVLLYFYLLASALQLKTPLPPYLPPAEKTRELLMIKLQQLPKITADLKKNNNVANGDAVKDECYMVYYAYVIMMESIIIELENLGQEMKKLFGSLVPDDQWARCFGLDLENNTLHNR